MDTDAALEAQRTRGQGFTFWTLTAGWSLPEHEGRTSCQG